MSGGELALVIAGVAVVVGAAVLGAVGVSLGRTLRELRRLLTEIRSEVLPAVKRIEEASGAISGEVQRVGGLLDVAETVSERAESLSAGTYRALAEPLGAVASLFRRGGRPDRTPAANSSAPRAGAPVRRRPSWRRRAAVYLARSAYRSSLGPGGRRLVAAARELSAQIAAALGGRRDQRDGHQEPRGRPSPD